MGKIALIPAFKEINGNCDGKPVEKKYTMEGVKILGQVSPYAVAPLRILGHVLTTKGIDYQMVLNGNDPWAITQMSFDDKNADYVKVALEEIMEYRCAFELGNECEETIQQLPFIVAMRTSDNIMAFGKSKDEQFYQDKNAELKWCHLIDSCKFMSDSKKDNLVIPKNEPVLRKHLICISSRGGYNIKTKGYMDTSLIHYCYTNNNLHD